MKCNGCEGGDCGCRFKVVGKVLESERNEIQTLHRHLQALEELEEVMPTESDMLSRLKTDLAATTGKCQEWWNRMSEKYQWESENGGYWEIDFSSCEILLRVC